MKILVVSDREYKKTTRGIDIITNLLAEKEHNVDHMLFFRRKNIPAKKVSKNITQLYFYDFLRIYRDKMRRVMPAFLLKLYFCYIIKNQKNIDFDKYDYVVLESGYATYLALVIKNKIIFRQSDPPEITFNSNRQFYRDLELLTIKKSVFVSSALKEIFYPDEYAKKFTYCHSGFIPIEQDDSAIADKAFVFMGGGEIDFRLIKKIAKKFSNYKFHIIGDFKTKIKEPNIIMHGYLEYAEYQKIVLSSLICIIPFTKRFSYQLRKCFWTAKVLLPMSLGMPILIREYGLVKYSDSDKKLFVYKTKKEALTLLNKIVNMTENGEITRKVTKETSDFLYPQILENRVKELDITFSSFLYEKQQA